MGISGDANRMGSGSVEIKAISTDLFGKANMVICASSYKVFFCGVHNCIFMESLDYVRDGLVCCM